VRLLSGDDGIIQSGDGCVVDKRGLGVVTGELVFDCLPVFYRHRVCMQMEYNACDAGVLVNLEILMIEKCQKPILSTLPFVPVTPGSKQ
jgi:hypothetical protein